MHDAEALVHAEALTRTYVVDGQTAHAVASADFTIMPGDRIALMGPSGSGKTTLLHLISGLDEPTTGSVSWPALGARTALQPSLVTLSFQGPSLLPALSVEENVALPLLLGGTDENEAAAAAREILARMGLEKLAGKLPEELSGGQSQRAGLARALVVRPSLLLADEPTGQQDHAHAEGLMQLVLNIVEETGAALLVATHDPAIAADFPARWSMRDGVLETAGEQTC
jgi:ABC-type lipoprotein export system ATPase subunit